MDFSSGIRQMQTLRKLPIAAPKTKAEIAQNKLIMLPLLVVGECKFLRGCCSNHSSSWGIETVLHGSVKRLCANGSLRNGAPAAQTV
jgi:hypothetical protein